MRLDKRNKDLIIDLIFITMKLRPLKSWTINENNPTLLDYVLILLEWTDLIKPSLIYEGKQKDNITEWNINLLKQNSEILKKAKEDYLLYIKNRSLVNYNSL
jgi:hypothetical protein